MNEEIFVPDKHGTDIVKEIYDWLESAIVAVLFVILLFSFLARMVMVEGESMLPTLTDGDRLISTRLYEAVETGDIVVVTKPNESKEPLIKRVIAVGGQTIDIDAETGLVYVDLVPLDESYIAETIAPDPNFATDYPQVVPDGHVFVMGDNRNNSWDSRVPSVGMIDERYILGKVLFRVWPYNKFGNPQHDVGSMPSARVE